MGSNIEDSVLLIKSSDPKINGFGTGFVLFRDQLATYVVTCAHVIREIGGPEKVMVNSCPARVVALGSQDGIEGIDLAVLLVEGLLSNLPALPLSTSVQKDVAFRLPGYQSYKLHGKNVLEFRALSGKVGEPTKVGILAMRLTRTWDVRITSEFLLAPGYSGSPLIATANNAVIGIITSMRDGGKKGTALPSDALKEIWPEAPDTLFKTEPLFWGTDGTPICSALIPVGPLPAFDPRWLKELDSSGGAVPLDSQFYIERQVDIAAKEQILRSGVTLRIKGSRQVGKTSLLARLLEHAHNHEYPYIYVDFQELESDHLHNLDSLLYYLAYRIADEQGANQGPDAYWKGQMQLVGSKDKITRFLSKEVLLNLKRPLLLILDEVDRIFGYEHFRTDFFSLIRSWHNKRAMPHLGIWKSLNIILTYSTEAFLFITDLNQSPFNVGTDFNMTDFARTQVELLNYKHGSPVNTAQQMESMMSLLRGHPFLTRRALYALTVQEFTVETLLTRACDEDGPFSDHLHHYLLRLQQSREQGSAMKSVIQNHTCSTDLLFYQLRSAGLVNGSSRTNVWPRCDLYAQYFQKHL